MIKIYYSKQQSNNWGSESYVEQGGAGLVDKAR